MPGFVPHSSAQTLLLALSKQLSNRTAREATPSGAGTRAFEGSRVRSCWGCNVFTVTQFTCTVFKSKAIPPSFQSYVSIFNSKFSPDGKGKISKA